jgi:hypothetical protein
LRFCKSFSVSQKFQPFLFFWARKAYKEP